MSKSVMDFMAMFTADWIRALMANLSQNDATQHSNSFSGTRTMNTDNLDTGNEAELRRTLNLETGKLGWRELQRHFARGAVIVVAHELDLINVAVAFVQDDEAQTKAWIMSRQIAPASDDDAQRWQQQASVFWSLVVAPWVLVQELETTSGV